MVLSGWENVVSLGSPPKIGVAVPCHIRDLKYFRRCLYSVRQLNPQPCEVAVDINDGNKSMAEIRSGLFNRLFQNCDVVLNCSADFYLHPSILQHVRRDSLVSFTPLFRRRFDFWNTLHCLFRRKSFSGCYSIPRRLWRKIEGKFDGEDDTVAKLCGSWQTVAWQYTLLRPYQDSTTSKMLGNFSLVKRLWWQLSRMKAVKIDGAKLTETH